MKNVVAEKLRRAGYDFAIEQIGHVTSVSGFKLTCRLDGEATTEATVGSLIKIPTGTTEAFGFVEKLEIERLGGEAQWEAATAQIDMLGELVTSDGQVAPAFSRGISIYPVLGAPVFMATRDDIAAVYAKSSAWPLPIGSLYQDPDKTAFLLAQDFLAKHVAIIGSTGSGKSCALTVILRGLLEAQPNGHIVVLDPHGEYASAFPGLAELATPDTLQLPYWLFSFDEIAEVFCSKDRIERSRESIILGEAIVRARQEFAVGMSEAARFTVDTPRPYRITTVLQRISAAMGKLDKPDNVVPYLRLTSNIETLRQDRRYSFMFEGLTLRDNMDEILSRLIRVPVNGRPLTIVDLSAVPSEIVDVVVSVLCRLIFDFALWTDRRRASPVLLVCDEAHRYIPQDERLGFEPTRRAIARIAKEGRKYGVSLCVMTQRPSELSEAVLSQCGTMVAMRTTNENDQRHVRSMLPDSASGLMNALSTLRQREAIVIGEGVAHPMRIRFNYVEPQVRPRSESTDFAAAWSCEDLGRADVAGTIDRWRRN